MSKTIQIKHWDKSIDLPYQKEEMGTYFFNGIKEIKNNVIGKNFLDPYAKRSYRKVFDVDDGILVMVYYILIATKTVDYEIVQYIHGQDCGMILFTKNTPRQTIIDSYRVIDQNILNQILEIYDQKY